MLSNRGADIYSSPMYDVEHAARQTGFTANLTEKVRGHRCEFAWLGDSSVADRNGGRDFPTQQIKRQIPRRNQTNHTARLAECVIERDVIGDVRFVFGVENGSRE